MTIKFNVNMQLVQDAIVSMGDTYLDTVRPAAQAMAQVYYEALLRSYDAAGIDTVTGNLKGSLYQAFRKEQSSRDKSMYGVSWAGRSDVSTKASQHAHLIEYGHWQKYQLVKNKRGQWVTAVRPGKTRKDRPKGDARWWTQEQRDEYFMPRKGGAKFVAAKPFMRPVVYNEALKEVARQAAIDKIEAILSRT